MGEAMGLFGSAFAGLGFFGGDPDQETVDQACRDMTKMGTTFVEGKDFPDCPEYLKRCAPFYTPHCHAMTTGINSHLPECNLDTMPHFNEAEIIEVIEYFKSDETVRAQWHNDWHYDFLIMGLVLVHPALYYGNLEAVDSWFSYGMEQWKRVDLPTTKEYAPLMMDVWDGNAFGCFLLLLLDRFSEAEEWLNVIGFTWDKEGFENMEIFWKSVPQAM